MPNTFEEYEVILEARERKGAFIVKVIVTVNLIFTVLSFVLSSISTSSSLSDIVRLLFWLFVFLMLYLGRPWAKWLFVIVSIIDFYITIRYTSELVHIPGFQDNSILIVSLALGIISVVVTVICSGFLLFSKCVKDFLYDQQTS